MRLRSWLNSWQIPSPNRRARRAQRGGSRPKPAGRRLFVEHLEDRAVPAFLPPVNYDAGSNPYAVATGNFNNDEFADLAVVNVGSNTVSVLLGNGDGTFQAALNSDTGSSPLSLAVGDFNADGNLDIATANNYDVSVLLGNGDGTMQAPSSASVYGNPQSVAVGDFNADGRLDLGVTSNVYVFDGYGYYGGRYYHWEGFANVLLGNGSGSTGDGTFAPPGATDAGYGIHSGAAVADVNGDGMQDFAACNFDYWTVSIMFGDGAGNLSGPFDYYAGGPARSVAAGDLNGDGNVDLATANSYYSSVGVLLGDGSGGFGGASTYAMGNYAAAVVLGNFDQDANLDIATANYSSSDVSVIRGKGAGAFTPAETFATGSNPWGIAVADFNDDGWLNAATANFGGNSASALINDQGWPPAGAPSVSINDVTVTEGNTGTINATFTISLSADYDQPVTVHYATSDGSATAGSDYTGASGDVTFAAHETTKTISIAVIGDRTAEPTENFAVNLTTSDAFIGDGHGVGTILDNEPRISISDATVTEGNTGSVNATFTVTLSAAYDEAVTVHFDTADDSATAGNDYTAKSGDVTIDAGKLTQTFTVAVLGDRSAEPTEDYLVKLSAPTAGEIVDNQGVGIILDNEPRISINDVAKKEGNGKTTVYTFTVRLSAAYDQTVTVNYATADGSATVADHDYQAKSGTVTFAPGQTSQTISIVVYGDKKKESDESFFVNLSSASSNSLLLDNQGLGTILTDDTHGNH